MKTEPTPIVIPDSSRNQIAEILERRANEIAIHNGEQRDKQPASVEFALSREIERLRRLASLVKPAAKPDEEDEN